MLYKLLLLLFTLLLCNDGYTFIVHFKLLFQQLRHELCQKSNLVRVERRPTERKTDIGLHKECSGFSIF
jgi:hypothetical protein